MVCIGRSNAKLLLDEEDIESDIPLPNRIEGDDTHTLRQITGSASIADWAKQNVGDTFTSFLRGVTLHSCHSGTRTMVRHILRG
jgi:hypothetical protein